MPVCWTGRLRSLCLGELEICDGMSMTKICAHMQTLRDCEMDELADEAQQRLKEDFALA